MMFSESEGERRCKKRRTERRVVEFEEMRKDARREVRRELK